MVYYDPYRKMGSKIPYIPERTRVFPCTNVNLEPCSTQKAPLCLRCGCSWWSSVRMLSSDSLEHLGKITAKRSPHLYIFTNLTVLLIGGWTDPIEKYDRQKVGSSSPKISGENKEICELPCHRFVIFGGPRFERKTHLWSTTLGVYIHPPPAKRKEPSNKT